MSIVTRVQEFWTCNGCRANAKFDALVGRLDVIPKPHGMPPDWVHIPDRNLDYCGACAAKIQWPGGCVR